MSDNGIEERYGDKSISSNFPLKLCDHRWLENGKVLTRFLEVCGKVAIFLAKSKERKKFPAKDERFPLLLQSTNSERFPVYCELLLSICRDIEPFRTLFQAERPLAVFLFQKLTELIVSLMERFVKPDVLQANCTGYKLLKLDLTKEVNLLPIESINVGFRAKAKLRELKTTEKTLMQHLWNGAQALLVRVIEKLRERCPLKFKMTRSISCLSPTEISLLKPELMKTRFSSLVQFLHDDGMVASIAAEKAEKQYSQLKRRILIFTIRVDEFFPSIFDSATMLIWKMLCSWF